MSSIASSRLSEERKNWRKDHPVGFHARPVMLPDNSTNIMEWECGIPGKEDTDWENGVYTVKMSFSSDYPMKPPTCRFSPPIFPSNVFSCGQICLSILDADKDWRPSISIKQIVLGIQDLLTNPNPKSPANGTANDLFLKKPAEYKKRIKAQAAKFISDV